jgi:ligand-binding sensor domain-containing protein
MVARPRRFALRDGAHVALLLLVLLLPARAPAAEIGLEPIVTARRPTGLLIRGQQALVGLEEGGVLVYDRQDPSTYTRWLSDDRLASNRVTDLSYSGRHLWVATDDAGLTQIDLEGAEPAFRTFTNLGGRQLTAVAGRVQQEREDVYYGVREGGVGVITNDLPGATYTAEEDGLVDDNVTALTFHRGELWIGTENGVSAFAGNVFLDRLDGLPNRWIRTFCSSGDSLLLAGTKSGVARWDSLEARWHSVGGMTFWIDSVTVDDQGGIWALVAGDGTDRLMHWDGAQWNTMSLPTPYVRAIGWDDGLWAAGEERRPDMAPQVGHALLALRADESWQTWVTDESLVRQVGGVSFGQDGTIWLAAQDGRAVSWRGTSGWSHIDREATAENDATGLIGFGANIFAIRALADGEVWLSQRARGLLRYVPARVTGSDDLYEQVTTDTSPLRSDYVGRIVVHPRGPLLRLTENDGVEILLDPARWREESQWVHLPTGLPGLGGIWAYDCAVARDDLIWFAVEDVGLVRWDLNGSAGPQDALSWQNLVDDVWSAPITSFTGVTYSPGDTRGVAVSSDGTVWVGGSGGVVHFSYDALTGTATVLESYQARVSVDFPGLLTAGVHDLVLDGNGDVWIGLDAGLNRIRHEGGAATIDAYTDLTSFLTQGFGSFYSTGIIIGLPHGNIGDLQVAPDGRRLLVGTDQGAALLTVPQASAEQADPLSDLYLYPNPFRPGQGSRLKLGGIQADVEYGSDGLPAGGARVVVYNLEGQQVARISYVESDQGFWDGSNLLGESVVSGLYVVKVSLESSTAVRTLAIVR